MNPDPSFWPGRSVLITGHTGFKGGWLTAWLAALGAHVHGYALGPPTEPSLFDVAGLSALLVSDTRADVADVPTLTSAMEQAAPEIVIHLAAQSLVREAYRDPLGTLSTNILGTANVLEAARHVTDIRAIVVITTDKVYEEERARRGHVETDALGGRDPYSASKAAAEIVAAAYRSSFFSGEGGHDARIATARAGNVVGGGDWSPDRLVPDCLRAFERGEPVLLRNPGAVRPWQHVLEPLSGYLRLAEAMTRPEGSGAAGPWNFGPIPDEPVTVAQVARLTATAWGADAAIEAADAHDGPYEAASLMIDASRAHDVLGWTPRWSLARALAATVSWHRAWRQGGDMLDECRAQIVEYEASGGR